MIISPFSPIFFLSMPKRTGIESRYVQIFSSSDSFFIQVIRLNDEAVMQCYLHDAATGNVIYNISPVTLSHGSNLKVDTYHFSTLASGRYYIALGSRISEPFLVTSDDHTLKDTVLMQYSPADNRQRADVVALLNGIRQIFSFRVPGGFKDNGWQFAIDNEQFVTDTADIVELYSRESTQKTLTVGDSAGVPIWVGQHLNRILTCRYFYIDGSRYVRFESSVPTKEQSLEGVNSFVFSQTLQEIKNEMSNIEELVAL